MAKDTANAVFLDVTLTTGEAEAFAQFLKRVQPEDYERRADPHDGGEEARLMRDAGLAIQAALRRHGFAPR